MAETVLKRRPIRGFLYGVVLGLGLMLIVVGQGWAALGTTPPFIVLILGLVLGTLWGLYAPAKSPTGDPPREPVEASAGPVTAPADEPTDDAVDDGEASVDSVHDQTDG